MNGTASPNAFTDDDILRERIIQTAIQVVPFKSTLNIQALLVIEADSEPKRTLLINKTYTDADRTRYWTNLQIAQQSLLGLSAAAAANLGLVQAHLLASQGLPSASHGQSHLSLLQLGENALSQNGASGSKRKAGRPCKIPQEKHASTAAGAAPTSLNNNDEKVLDLSKNEQAENGAAPSSEPWNTEEVEQAMRVAFNNSPFNLISDTVVQGSPVPAVKTEKSSSSSPGASFQPVFPSPQKIAYESPFPTTPKKSSSTPSGTPKRSRNSKTFSCNQCKAVFPSLNQLCKHTFSDHRAFRCTLCGANFTQRSNLQRHSLKHVGFKPFICNVCTKAYYRKDHLVRHIEVTHPDADPKGSITVKLTSSECLEYLEKMHCDLDNGSGCQKAAVISSSPNVVWPGDEDPTLDGDDHADHENGFKSKRPRAAETSPAVVWPGDEDPDNLESDTDMCVDEGGEGALAGEDSSPVDPDLETYRKFELKDEEEEEEEEEEEPLIVDADAEGKCSSAE